MKFNNYYQESIESKIAITKIICKIIFQTQTVALILEV